MRRSTTALRYQDGEITAAKSEPDRRIRYGGAWVSVASALPLAANAIRPRPVARLVAASVRRPQRLAVLIALLLRTPTERVVLSETTTGQVLNEYFRQRAMWVVPRKRFFRGTLLLPEDHEIYLGGRHRKTLRRNLRRAAVGGISCEVVTDRLRALEDISDVLCHHPRSFTGPGFQAVVDRVRRTAQRPESTVVVARDGDGRPVAILTCIIDDMVCLITSAVATRREPRWALHDHLVRLLIVLGASDTSWATEKVRSGRSGIRRACSIISISSATSYVMCLRRIRVGWRSRGDWPPHSCWWRLSQPWRCRRPRQASPTRRRRTRLSGPPFDRLSCASLASRPASDSPVIQAPAERGL